MLIALAAGMVAGIVSQVFWVTVPAGFVPVSFACLLLPLACLLRKSRVSLAVRSVLSVGVGVAIGVCWAAFTATALLESRLPAGQEGEEFTLAVEVLSMRQHDDGSAGWTVAALQLPWGEGCRLPAWRCRLRIDSWEPMPLLPGEAWQLRLRLKRPHAPQNLGAADFERFLFGERIVATGTVRPSPDNVRLSSPSGFVAWRARLLEATLPLLGDGPGDVAIDESQLFARAVLPALVVDERSMMVASQWRVLADTGTAHLVAISGLHVALLWGAILWAFALLSRRGVALVRYERTALLSALLAAFVYAAIAGMPLPAQRAVLMLAVATAFLLYGGAIPVWRVWLAACAAVLLLDPLSVHAAGFWLSFGAVGLLLLLGDLHRRRMYATAGAGSRLARAAWLSVQVQWMLTLLLAPLLFALFGTASVSSVLANLPAIPWVNLLALPPALLGMLLSPWSPEIADALIDLAVGSLAVLWEWLEWVDALDLLRPAALPASTPAGLWAMGVSLAILLFARRTGVRLAMLLVLVLCWPVPERIPVGEADVCVLDVGQGLSVAIRTAGHAALYDTGPSRGGSAGEGTPIVGILRAFGIRDLDLLVLSHRDPEHAGAALSVVRAFRPRSIIAGEPVGIADLSSRACDEELAWRADGVTLRILPGDPQATGNDRSCILQVEASGRRVLVPGDIGRRRELALSERYGDSLCSDVLVAAAHGSRSSNGPTFLARVSPSWIVSSNGYRNRFGQPAPEVRERAAAMGARFLSTPESGALCMRLGPGEVVLRGQRELERRHWRL